MDLQADVYRLQEICRLDSMVQKNHKRLIDELEQRIHEAYEVFANMEGLHPTVLKEPGIQYLMGVIDDMVEELTS